MIAMGGHPQPARDKHGIYRAACQEFADELGWRHAEIWDLFKWFAAMREYEMRIPRALAEHFALEDVRASIDKRGASDPC